MPEVDDFDLICHIAYDQKPLTRRERAENVRKRDCLSKYGPDARKVLDALLDYYANYGIYDMTPMQVLTLEPFNKMGSVSKIVQFFGGKNAYVAAVHELEHELYTFAG